MGLEVPGREERCLPDLQASHRREKCPRKEACTLPCCDEVFWLFARSFVDAILVRKMTSHVNSLNWPEEGVGNQLPDAPASMQLASHASRVQGDGDDPFRRELTMEDV